MGCSYVYIDTAMSHVTDEIRHAIRSAAESNATTLVKQPQSIDVFEREANALFTPGLTRGEVSRRAILRMGLSLNDDACTPNAVHFDVKRSALYSTLVVHIGLTGCTGYTLSQL